MLKHIPISTIGHSTHPIEEFIAILKAHGIERLIDVRTVPRSRRNPQFSRETLAHSLRSRRIGYRHMPALGGLRHSQRDSENTAWRNASFRGYADYMQTEAFEAALNKLIELSAEKPTAIMCAEAVPWRCHRSLIADALTARGIPVVEILSATNARPHAMTAFAKVRGHQVTYPGKPETAQLKFDESIPIR